MLEHEQYGEIKWSIVKDCEKTNSATGNLQRNVNTS